jgi:hypothetical protein
MSIANSISVYYSGGLSNNKPEKSLGGDFSTFTIPNFIENLFVSVDSDAASSGQTDYRCIYVFNEGEDNLNETSVWLDMPLPVGELPQLSLGSIFQNDVQQITFSPYPISGTLNFTYIDAKGDDYISDMVTWKDDPVLFGQDIQQALLNIRGAKYRQLQGIYCQTQIVGSTFTVTINFAEESGNTYQNLLIVNSNLIGCIPSIIKIADGSPTATIAQTITTGFYKPTGVTFFDLDPKRPIKIGTVKPHEGFPLWVKRVIPISPVPVDIAGATLKVRGLVYPPLLTPTPTVTATNTPTPSACGATPDATRTPTPTPSMSPTATPMNTDPTPSPTATPNATRIPGTMWCWGNVSLFQGFSLYNNIRSSPVQILAGSSWSNLIVNSNYTAIGTKLDGPNTTLWTWGNNNGGILGNNENVFRSYPEQTICTETNWSSKHKHLSMSLHVGAIKQDGSLWMWGENRYGQTGVNYKGGISSPTQTVCATKNWDTIACGGFHTAAVKIDGSLWTWGQNYFGQLGTKDKNHRSSPTQIAGYNWASVACGEFHTVAIKTDKTLWTWGFNKYGQLGTGDLIHRSSPIQISGTYKLPSSDNPNIWCGYSQTFVARHSDSAVFACGQNLYNQIGVGDIGVTIKNLTAIDMKSVWMQEPGAYFILISSSEYHTCAITNNGAIWCWGATQYGQSGTNMAYRTSGLYEGEFEIPTSPILMNVNRGWKSVTAFSFITDSDSGTGAV